MIFTAPWLLLALAALPVLWWLLRVTPPAPRTQSFPAIRLLRGLRADERTAARTPWWLLAAAPVRGGAADRRAGRPGAGRGARAGRRHRADAAGRRRRLGLGAGLDRAHGGGRASARPRRARRPPRHAADHRALGDRRRPRGHAGHAGPGAPHPARRAPSGAVAARPGRRGGRAALACMRREVVYVADGLALGGRRGVRRRAGRRRPGHADAAGPGRGLASLRPPRLEADRLVARVEALPQPADRPVAVLAQTGDGRTLARADAVLRAGQAGVDATDPAAAGDPQRDRPARARRLRLGRQRRAAGRALAPAAGRPASPSRKAPRRP